MLDLPFSEFQVTFIQLSHSNTLLFTMSSAALESKNRGNDAFSKKNFDEAIKHFTEAISLDPSNHVLYSNRSAAYASLSKFKEALDDAEKTVSLKPDWPKVFYGNGSVK